MALGLMAAVESHSHLMFPLAPWPQWSFSLLHDYHMSPLPNIMARYSIRMSLLTIMMASTSIDQRFASPDQRAHVSTPPKITQVSY